MEYEKKYKKALERAKKLYEQGTITESLGYVFPELQESEDDRIVRCLLNYFNHVRYNGLDLKGTDVDEVIAWLEKQGKTLDADKVIEWIEEHVPTKFEDMQNYVEQFKKDFGL